MISYFQEHNADTVLLVNGNQIPAEIHQTLHTGSNMYSSAIYRISLGEELGSVC